MVSVFILVTLLIIILDQATKFVIFHFRPHLDLKIIEIIFIKNTGAGFGLLQNYTWLLTIVSFLAASLIIIYYPRLPKEKIPQTLFALLLGGIIGNLIDRLFRSYVIDFLNFKIWPAFNIADASITVAAIGLMIYYWKK